MKKYVKIDGIHCDTCKQIITSTLLKNKNISKVTIDDNIATIECNSKLSNKSIIKIINSLNYFTKEEYISDNNIFLNNKIKLSEFIIITIILILICIIIYKIFGFNIFNAIPNIDSNITYGMLILTGFLTSIHCVSMCGAINLIAIYSNHNNKIKPLLYNLGRVLSYTLLGGLVGLLGKTIQINNMVSGIIIIICSILMFILSLKMMGIITFKLPCLKTKKYKTSNAFLIGLLNGFMPCGPLQAMQVYALSTGSFIKGALSMFLFSLGTIPLMLSIGILFNITRGKGKVIINKVSSILILILSLIMLNRGLLFLNIDLFKENNLDNYHIATINEGIQTIEFDLSYDNYQDIIIEKDIPLVIIIHVDSNKLTGCNNALIIPDFDIDVSLNVGDNYIEFTPDKIGTFTYTCWMNMIKNNIKVVDNLEKYK